MSSRARAKIHTHLWYAKEAARYYASIFPDDGRGTLAAPTRDTVSGSRI